MDFRFCKQASRESLAAAQYDPKKLTVIHSGAALLLSLVVFVLSFLLSSGIDSTGGLSGIGTRSLLELGQALLSIVSYICLPFWEIGFFAAAIGFARRESVNPRTLTTGFSRFGPVLRMYLLQALLYMAVVLACMNIASMIFAMTPFSAPLMELLLPMMEQSATVDPTQITPDMALEILQAAIPMYVIFLILFLGLCIPISYRLRMAPFAIMDDAPRARAALSASNRMMKGNCFALFRQDLRFWWYYAGLLLLTVLSVTDVLLALMGVALPVDGTVISFVIYILYLSLSLGYSWLCKAEVQTAYAHCYLAMKQTLTPPAPELPPIPKELP